MAAAKRADATPATHYHTVMKSLGLARLDAFRRADLTPELRRKAGVTAEDEHRLTAGAELSRLGLPTDIAQALALSGAIGSASELAALSVGEIERVLAEAPVKRLLPAGFSLDRAALEDMLRRVTPLTADESAPGRSALAEADAPALARDEDLPLAAEELTLDADRITAMLAALKERWSKAEMAIETLARATAAPVEGAVLRATLAELQGGIAGALDDALAPVSGEFRAVDEAIEAAAADEALDPAVEVARLQGELRRIELTIDGLRAVAASGSEATSPATASEAGASERETSPRGE
ncbi:hypothetical protein [Elioraea sp.]|uniref:hypothetical protein n=1 Tax=Elioraea sp. TaxID=2185103 RepID=UPI003F73021F